MKKFILSLLVVFTFAAMQGVKAQNMCPPGSCDQCMVIKNVTNNTGCPLEFIWGYDSYPCSGYVGAGIVNPSGFLGLKTGPCVQFCDDPCECPATFLLKNPAGPGTIPLDINSSGAAPVGALPITGGWEMYYCNVFMCNGVPITAKVTYVNGQYEVTFAPQKASDPC